MLARLFVPCQRKVPKMGTWEISTDKSASVYRWRGARVAIAIAASACVKAERMRHLIADFDAGQKSAYGKLPESIR